MFRRPGLPVEVIQEFEAWRQVRDAGGHRRLGARQLAEPPPHRAGPALGGQGRADAAPASASLRDDDSDSATPVAQVEAGVLANIITCDKRWCRISVGDYRGYIEQAKLWGTYPNEVIK